MTRGDDDRGLSAVLGAVLLMLILVVLVSTLQATGVPNWNRQVEFDHNQRVQEDMVGLRNAVVGTAADGGRRSQLVDLAPAYPRRVVLRNPSPPAGALRTGEPGSITIENATATGETGDYWSSGAHAFTTRPVVYAPSYNFYRSAPETVLETGVVYNRFDGASVALADQGVVDGDRIALLAVNGSLTERGTDATTVDVRPTSAPARAIAVTDGPGPITIRIPTRLANETWARLLESEYTGNGGHIANQSYATGSPYDTLVLTLEPGVTYELRMATAGLGAGVVEPGAHYLTVVEGDGARIPVDGEARVVFEVRDRFNNPVSGVTVNGSVVSGGGSVTPANDRTGEAGRATFTYTSSTATTATIEGNISASPSALEEASVAIEVDSSGGGGGDGLGPETSDVRSSKDSMGAGETFTLTANASDVGRGGTQLIAAEWFRNTSGDPGEGDANPMAPTDGSFDTVTEEVENTSVDTSGWGAGGHTLSVRGRDANGNWGPVANTTVTITSYTNPSFASLVVDDTTTGNKAGFGIDYTVDDPDGRFSSVNVSFENLDAGTTAWANTTSTGGGGDEVSYTGPNFTSGDTYRITIRLYDTSGSVVESHVHSEVADGSGGTTIV